MNICVVHKTDTNITKPKLIKNNLRTKMRQRSITTIHKQAYMVVLEQSSNKNASTVDNNNAQAPSSGLYCSLRTIFEQKCVNGR